MTYVLADEQLRIQETVRRVAREKVAGRAGEIDARAEYPHDMFDLLKGLGLFTLPFPPAYGGRGSLLSACFAVEELGRVRYNTAYLLVVQWSPFGAILAGGDDEQNRRLLPGLASGDLRAGISVTEPQSGSDVAGIRTRARPCDGGYRITGGKIWCTNAAVADFVLVAAKTGNEDGSRRIEIFIVERGTPGFEIGRREDKMGARGIPSCALHFDDAFGPEANRLAAGGDGFKTVMAAFSLARPVMGARSVGLAQGAIDHAIEFVRSRHAFGQRVADFQGIRWMIADMAMQTEAARHLVYRAAALAGTGVSSAELAPIAAMAKRFATDTAMRVAENAVQLFGAAGISAEYPINRYFRDAKVLQIIEGTNQIQRSIIAQSLLGRAPRA
jgi:acyl-CoA dehydrogenase